MTSHDLYLIVGGCLLTGFFAGVGVTLLYLRANLHLRSEAEWQRACMDDMFDEWEKGKVWPDLEDKP